MTETASRIFVDAWDLYQKVVGANCMFHREIGAELKRLLGDRIRSPPLFHSRSGLW